MKMKKIFWHTLLWLNWGIIFWFWWTNSGKLISPNLADMAIVFGRLAGLVAAYMILLQFFFMGRLPFLERVFGLDKLAKIHKKNGKWGFYFLILHPILLVWGYSRLAKISLVDQFLDFFFNYPHVYLAVIGLILFIIVVISSIKISRSRLRYEWWYFVHLIAYLAVFTSFWHQIRVGTDLLSSQIFYWYWIWLYLFVFANHLIFRFVRPIYNFFRHQFYVIDVVRETYQAVSIYIGGKNLDRFQIHPGQFMIFRFLAKKFWWQAHPFSLSILPEGKQLRITVKALGDFTAQISDLKIGTRILIDGPYGVFTDLFCVSPKVLLLAGGIGITPIRSLFEQMVKKGRDVSLLYLNKTQKDIVFKDELEIIAQHYGGRVKHIISEEPDFSGEKGRIDQEKIQRLAPDYLSREIYLCGPIPMMDATLKILQELGIPRRQIRYEKFEL
ncbi:MAG: hypothetical protein A2729_05285 [Candidatus Buchananbacteria bacterium RIFCSPHIGHO2_01_FULL_39_14]|uniref:FAD-binding FR-type domain-containing protein n=2 Tax=Candidatus Buchananiibacteriota TaxID=1817903 RepID=A0A1G1YQA4_9BACT|nr:MAG: hypothetical protein A2729_05285 [Candidatus Buchananbacteria bacterium RIFCSPHIGHO2_01_FULL_39_14]OGY48096.1 MAG: hypothetical protein A3D39_00045 [Candidatus Buchananbacteria bacterium RIFCSPHIGHO2_02_FULL_39_17]OGY54474.1 MAG: hypothetical protein A2912_05795 [Candidatus Buchananbacteria bacterium RIFCSPLOWO2_01_FULL_40_23b]